MEREKRRKEKDEQDNACSICYEPLFNSSRIEILHARLRNCNCVLHIQCLRPHVEAMLSQNILTFTCPNSECLKPIHPVDLNDFLTQEIMEKIHRMSISSAVDGTDDLSWCPTPGCGYAFVKDQARFSCPLCYKDYCLDCRVDFH